MNVAVENLMWKEGRFELYFYFVIEYLAYLALEKLPCGALGAL